MYKQALLVLTILTTLVLGTAKWSLRSAAATTLSSPLVVAPTAAHHTSLADRIDGLQTALSTEVITVKLGSFEDTSEDRLVDFKVSPNGGWVIVHFTHQWCNEIYDCHYDDSLRAIPLTGGEMTYLSYLDWLVDYSISPDSSRMLYRSEEEDPAYCTPSQLYSISLMDREVVQLSEPNPEPGSGCRFVESYIISPDSNWAVYLERQPTTPLVDLFSVPLTGGEVVKLNAPLLTGREIHHYNIAPDGSYVVYLADHDVNDRYDLYSVLVTGGEVVKLNPSLIMGGNIIDGTVMVSPDSSRVVYLADQETDGVDELYSVALAGGEVVKLNAPLGEGGRVISHTISDDSSRVVYLANQETDSVSELYSVPLAGGEVVKLNTPPVNGGDVVSFAVSPNSSRVVYLADQETDGVDELYSVALAGGEVIRLNPSLADGSEVHDFAISPDSTRVVFDTGKLYDTPELYSTPLAGGEVVKLYDRGWRDSVIFVITSGSSHVVFWPHPNPDIGHTYGLFSVPLAGGRVVVLKPPVQYVQERVMSREGNQVVFRTGQEESNVTELYATHFWPHGFDIALYLPLMSR